MSQGLSEDDARNRLAGDIFTQKYNKFNSEIPKLGSAIEDLKNKQAEYEKLYFPDGNIRLDNTEVSQKWQELVKTRQAYETQKKEYEGEKLKLDDPNTQEKEIQQYKMLGSSYYGNQIFDNTIRSVARGLAGITASTELKEDKPYWNQVEHNDKMIKNNVDLQIAQIRAADGGDGGTGGGGAAMVVDPFTGQLTAVENAAPKTKVSKMTEAEKKLAQLNNPDYRGMQKLPQDIPIVQKLADDKRTVDDLSVRSGMRFVTSALSEDLSGFGGVLLQQLKAKHDQGKFWGEQAVEYTTGSTKAVDANFQNAMTSFKNKYGEEYQQFLDKSSVKTPTYGSIYNFLVSKAQNVFDKGLINPANLADAKAARESSEENAKVLENINNDYKVIGNTLLQKVLTPEEYAVLVTVDNDGYKRIKTKQEIQEDYAKASEVSRQPNPAWDGRYGSQYIDVYRDPGTMKRLKPFVGDNYNKTITALNTTLAKQSAQLYTLQDEKLLSQPKMISYTEDPTVQGEVAESAINTIFSLENIADLGGKEDKKPNVSSIDYTQLVGKNGSKTDAYDVVKELYNYSTSGNRGLTTITYMQFDPTYDNIGNPGVKAYNIRFDSNAVIKDLRSTFKENPSKLAIIDKIATDGLTIRTPVQAPGFLSEYGPVERQFQTTMSYESPTWLKPYTSYTINKYEDQYIIRGNFTYKDEMGNPKTVDFGEMKVPYNGSFQSIKKMMDSYIFGQINIAEEKYKNSQKALQKQAPGMFLPKADAENRVRNQF
jgi:hypothetical protein